MLAGSLDSLNSDAIISLPASVENIDNFEASFDHHKLYNCSICLGQYPKKEIRRLCANKHIFCKTCSEHYIINLIDQSKVQKIKCPYNTCTEHLEEHLIRELLDDKEFQRFQNTLLEKHLIWNMTQRLCPQSKCDRVLTISQEKPYSECQCGAQLCNTCNKLWHTGKTCLEAMHTEFQLSHQEKEEIKFCIMCKSIVQRVEGCTHITCPVCDYDWCWICGNEYTQNHTQKCPNTWKPNPILHRNKPRKDTELSIENKIKLKKRILRIMSFPLRAFLLPAIVFGLWKQFKKADKLRDKMCLGACCFLLNIVYNIALLFLLILMVTTHDIDSIYIYLVPIVVLLLPYILHTRKLFHKERTVESVEEKRWASMDPNTFQYTSVSRPINGSLNLKEFMSNNSVHIDVALQQSSNIVHLTSSQGDKEYLPKISVKENHKDPIDQSEDVVLGIPLS